MSQGEIFVAQKTAATASEHTKTELIFAFIEPVPLQEGRPDRLGPACGLLGPSDLEPSSRGRRRSSHSCG